MNTIYIPFLGRYREQSLEEIDFSALDNKGIVEMIDYASEVERIVHGYVWKDPHFREFIGQRPIYVKTENIECEEGIDYNKLRGLIYENPYAHVFLFDGHQHFLPHSTNWCQPWMRDYSLINRKAGEILSIIKNYK